MRICHTFLTGSNSSVQGNGKSEGIEENKTEESRWVDFQIYRAKLIFNIIFYSGVEHSLQVVSS